MEDNEGEIPVISDGHAPPTDRGQQLQPNHRYNIAGLNSQCVHYNCVTFSVDGGEHVLEFTPVDAQQTAILVATYDKPYSYMEGVANK